jgi:hypothetical protein
MSREYIQLRDVDPTDYQDHKFEYCPISVKEKMNPPADNYFDTMTNTQIFLSNKNIYYILYVMVSLNKSNKTSIDTNKLQEKIPKLMAEWAIKNKIDRSTYVTGDIIQNLEFLNNKFLNSHKNLYSNHCQDTLNVLQLKHRVTDRCGRESSKKYNEMLASDYHTLNLWNDKSNDIYTYNAVSRDCNKIPLIQKSMNTRHYDRSNDGLRVNVPDQSSLNNQNRGYDMSNIIKGSTIYENY